MTKAEKNIPVLDQDNKFLSKTSPAKARILIKKGRALVFNKDPFMIKMLGDGEMKMQAKRTAAGLMGTSITNFTKYFAEEREVYVQNMGSTQISLSFPDGMGDHAYVIIPRTRKPFNLTQHVPFEAIKRGMDFRKIINRKPPLLRLIEEEEFIEYYEKLSDRNNTSFETELGKAQDLQNVLMNKPVLSSDRMQREMEEKLEEKMEELEKPVEMHPQVIGLCAQADKSQGAQRINAGDFIEELESLELDLTVDDYEFVATRGVYKLVKNFAAKKLEELTADNEDDE
jgi:hypothetical protein